VGTRPRLPAPFSPTSHPPPKSYTAPFPLFDLSPLMISNWHFDFPPPGPPLRTRLPQRPVTLSSPVWIDSFPQNLSSPIHPRKSFHPPDDVQSLQAFLFFNASPLPSPDFFRALWTAFHPGRGPSPPVLKLPSFPPFSVVPFVHGPFQLLGIPLLVGAKNTFLPYALDLFSAPALPPGDLAPSPSRDSFRKAE